MAKAPLTLSVWLPGRPATYVPPPVRKPTHPIAFVDATFTGGGRFSAALARFPYTFPLTFTS